MTETILSSDAQVDFFHRTGKGIGYRVDRSLKLPSVSVTCIDNNADPR